MESKDLTISSFNCSGFKPRNYDYLRDIFGKCEVLLLQETWLYNFEANLFSNVIPGCNFHAISAMDESDITRVGRPYGGCAILWNNKLALSITPIETASDRMCAVLIKSNELNLVLCNVYMPVDDNSIANFDIYGDVLHEIITIIELYRGHDIIIGGDFNVDFSRDESRNLGLLKHFIDEEGLKCVSLQCSNNEYTFENHVGNRSFIDHFIVSESLINCKVNIAHDGNNLTEHRPITLETTCSSIVIKDKIIYKNKIVWDKVTNDHKENYKQLLNHYLRYFMIPDSILSCNDFNCKEHDNLILEKLEQYIDILKFCAEATLPNKNFSNRQGIVGWNEFVKPYKEKSIFWNDIWKTSGKPQTGQLAELRKFSKSRYRWAQRKAHKETKRVIINETAQQLANKSFREFWGTMKKLKGTNRTSSNVIDGICNDQEIANNFKDIYEDLFNSVEDRNFNKIINEVNEKVTQKCNTNTCGSLNCHEITSEILMTAVKNLKRDKNDETYYLSSNHIINASDLAIDILSKILNVMLKHGTASEMVNRAVIKPIPKNMQKSLSVSNNYRAISKNTIISKVIDYVTIEQIKDKLDTSSYQFAYKEGFSTSMCSFLVAETIQYYKSHGSDVYMLSLDASKAFDRVKYSKLFKLLLERDICALIIRFMLKVYIFSSATVKWNNSESESFNISNGVKQGAIISAPLFAIYIDPLIRKLNTTKAGCFIGNICANAFAYADDVVILSPSCTALRKLIEICEIYAIEYDIKFNPDKCTLLIFSKLKSLVDIVSITLFGSRIKNIDSEKHLGHVFDSSFTHSFNLININNIIRDMKVRTNTITTQFKSVSWKSKAILFNSQCLSLYSCQLWRLDDPKIEQLCTTWKVCCRRLLKLHARTRSRFIHHLMNTAPLMNIVMYRMLNFLINGLENRNNLISSFFKNALIANTSYMKVNLNKILEKFNISHYDIYNMTKYELKNKINYVEEKDWQCKLIEEILNLRDGTLMVNFDDDQVLEYNEIQHLLDQLTTDFVID